MAIQGSGARFRRRKKEQIFVEGYYIDHADVATPGEDRQDETFHLFGNDNPETDVQHNYGTLTLGVLDKYSNNAILDVVTSQDPASTAARQYRVQDLTAIDVWANIKNAQNTQYVKAWLLTQWVPSMPLPAGDPNSKAAYSLTGNGDLIRQFQDCYITAKKIASGGSLGVTPMEVPNEPDIYALHVKAIDQTAGIFEQEKVPVSTTMVGAAGAIGWTEIEGLVQELDAVTHAYILFLQSGVGVYPTILPDKLRA